MAPGTRSMIQGETHKRKSKAPATGTQNQKKNNEERSSRHKLKELIARNKELADQVNQLTAELDSTMAEKNEQLKIITSKIDLLSTRLTHNIQLRTRSIPYFKRRTSTDNTFHDIPEIQDFLRYHENSGSSTRNLTILLHPPIMMEGHQQNRRLRVKGTLTMPTKSLPPTAPCAQDVAISLIMEPLLLCRANGPEPEPVFV